MRAIQISEWTSPEQLRVSQIEAPACGDEQVLIGVKASAISYSLSLLVQGRYQRKPAFPFVPGNTVAGIVLQAGRGVRLFKPGDRVVASLEYGGLAEQAVAHEDNTWAIPQDMPFDQATTLNTSYNSVAAALTWPHLLNVQPGQLLLVTGAGGGTGGAAIQIGKLLGARVIAAASSESRRAKALGHGAQLAVPSEPTALRDVVHAAARSMGEPQGVHAVIEPVGGAVFDAALRCLQAEGRILPLGFAGGEIPQVPANVLLVKNIAVCGLYMGYYKIDQRARYAPRMRALYAQLCEWWQRGLIRPEVGACVGLEQMAEGFARVLDRTHDGHVVVELA